MAIKINHQKASSSRKKYLKLNVSKFLGLVLSQQCHLIAEGTANLRLN